MTQGEPRDVREANSRHLSPEEWDRRFRHRLLGGAALVALTLFGGWLVARDVVDEGQTTVDDARVIVDDVEQKLDDAIDAVGPVKKSCEAIMPLADGISEDLGAARTELEKLNGVLNPEPGTTTTVLEPLTTGG